VDEMLIEKILNNNVITTIDDSTKLEKVVMGRGLAFKKKVGDVVDPEKIEKVFIIENKKENMMFQRLLNEIPIEYVKVSHKIIEYAKETLKVDFAEHIYIALTDHLAFAIKRHENGIQIKNDLLWEIKRIHRNEYKVGVWALDYIEKNLSIKMELDEAGFIALHLIDASLNQEMNNTVNMTNVIQEILNIIKYFFLMDFDENDMSYDRLMTHLRYFSQRVLAKKQMPDETQPLLEMLKKSYAGPHNCVLKIKDFIDKNYDYHVNDAEVVYLTIHIERVISHNKNR
jgi:beta-glucoside operon transcriptional antiterminator